MNKSRFRILGRDDQLVTAICLSIFLIVVCFHFWIRSAINGGLIEFEDMPGKQAVYLVDINSAPWQEFANLSGIGEKLAKQIVTYREQHGPFETVDQLKEVAGIGELKLKAMRPCLVVVEGPLDLDKTR